MLRILYFGMEGTFSVPPLQALIQNDIQIIAVIVPHPNKTAQTGPLRLPKRQMWSRDDSISTVIPLQTRQPTIIDLAEQHTLPVWGLNNLRDKKTHSLFRTWQPDLICVVCFPYLFPKSVLNLPRYGCVNLHPSLLPAYRGPDPLYWILKHQEKRLGVTLHFMDEDMDNGDIIFQTTFEIPETYTEADLSQRCAEEGAKLLITAIQQLEHGPLPRRPQPIEGCSYYPTRDKDLFSNQHFSKKLIY